jgi:hypothetical protein
MNNTQANPGQASSTPGPRIMQSPSKPPRPPQVPADAGTAAGVDRIGGYDFPWIVNTLERHGRHQFGGHFAIREKDHDILRKLLIYFLADKPLAAQHGIDLTKGIMLTGPIGCGKTSIITLMKLVPKPDRAFTLKPSRDVSFEFIQEGYEIIHQYGKRSYTHAGPKAYCFDDLGAERSLKYFGNECNVMAEIILSRYDHYMMADMVTHVTTNLSATELEESYGARVRSRMREMFNLLAFQEGTADKRL